MRQQRKILEQNKGTVEHLMEQLERLEKEKKRMETNCHSLVEKLQETNNQFSSTKNEERREIESARKALSNLG